MIRTNDPEYIRSIFCHPAIYPHVCEDTDPSADEWAPTIDGQVVYLRPPEGGACFLFHPHTRHVWEVHSAVLPEYRGRSLSYVRACADWLRQNTSCKCLLTRIPKGNVAAFCLARAVGMQKTGVLPASFLNNGQWLDQSELTMRI